MPDGKPRKGKSTQPPWDFIDQAKGILDPWVNPSRIPVLDGFRFGRPNGMAEEDALAMASHIVQGELGLLKPEQAFKWVGQEVTDSPTDFHRVRMDDESTRYFLLCFIGCC